VTRFTLEVNFILFFCAMMLILLLLIGAILGAIGGGGGLLLFPLLVYLQGYSIDRASLLSMCIVSGASIIALVSQKVKWKEMISKEILFFILGAVIMIFSIKGMMSVVYSKMVADEYNKNILNSALMFAFIPIIVYSAYRSWPSVKTEIRPRNWNAAIALLWGMITGMLAALFGAGGGFIIVPVLQQRARLEIKKAISASLVIISVNGLIGGWAPSIINKSITIQECWWLLSVATGAVIGGFWSSKQKPETLKKGLSIFLWAVGLTIFVKEILKWI
jgi:uncharacterized membrane protein YfcA